MENYLSLKAASTKCGLSIETLRAYIKSGLLPCKRIGIKKIIVNPDDIFLIGNPNMTKVSTGAVVNE